MVLSKDEATSFNADIVHTDNFTSFKYQARLYRNIEANRPNVILRNTTIAVQLVYLLEITQNAID